MGLQFAEVARRGVSGRRNSAGEGRDMRVSRGVFGEN